LILVFVTGIFCLLIFKATLCIQTAEKSYPEALKKIDVYFVKSGKDTSYFRFHFRKKNSARFLRSKKLGKTMFLIVKFSSNITFTGLF
jgi:hypothetical protein